MYAKIIFLKVYLKSLSLINYKNIAENVKNQWENALNMKVNIIKANFVNFIANLQSGKFDIAQTSWKSEYNDPMSFLEILKKQI